MSTATVRKPEKSGPTILVVDDTEDVRALLRMWLERRGYQVAEAEDGEEAVSVALSARPALILMDIGMPHRSGISSTYKLRQHPELRDVPIVMVTAYHTRELHLEAVKAGSVEVLTKPIDTERLEILLRRLAPVVGTVVR